MPNHFLGEGGLKSKLQRKRLSPFYSCNFFYIGFSFKENLSFNTKDIISFSQDLTTFSFIQYVIQKIFPTLTSCCYNNFVEKCRKKEAAEIFCCRT